MITRRLLLSGLTAAPALSAMPALAQADTPETVLDAAIAGAGAPPAMIAAGVDRDGLRWTAARGLRRFDGADAVTAEDRWHLGSNTKAMTAALWGRLVDQGRARFGMTLSEAFPGVALDPAFADTTLVQVMQHRAGLKDADTMGREWLMSARGDPRSLTEQRAALTAGALGKGPTGAPGAFAYGNINYIVAGAAIERLTGQPWEEVMRTELFGPLGIRSGAFGAPKGAGGAENAWGHRPNPAGGLMPMTPDSPGADNPLAMGPAGGASMTVGDYARFIRVFLNQGAGWLKPDTVRALITPPSGEGRPYALGWGVSRPAWAEGTPVLAHEGSNTLWHALAMVAPDTRKALILCANAFSPPVMQATAQKLVGML